MSLFNDAKLILTPNAYKAGKLYSIKPFDGSGDFDVVRATTAWRRNASGVWESVANNVPRLHYPVGGGCPSCLVEPQRTNEIINSSFLNDGVNITTHTRTISGSIIYFFTSTSDYFKLNITGISGQRLHFSRTNTVINGETYILSCYVHVISGNPIIRDILFPTSIPINQTRVNGAVTPETNTIGGVGIYLIEMEITTTSTSQSYRVGLGAALTLTYSAQVEVYLPQLERGLTASSRILTTSATVTRNADVIDVTTPAGVTEIVETFADGTTNTETTIPATYQLPNGEIKSIVMT